MEVQDREESQEMLGTKEEDSPQQESEELNNCEELQVEENGDSNGAQVSESEDPVKEKSELKEKSTGVRKASRFHPYNKEQRSGPAERKGPGRNRVFISNIPYDMKWQAIKDLVRDKVGEVTYVELFKDAEGKSRGCGVVEFKDGEFVKKAIEVMTKQDLSGRPLNIREDFDGEHARRALHRGGGQFPGGHGADVGPALMNLPPSIVNNPNLPPEIISALHTGRLGTTVFVANLDFKVGWKKLKEVLGMAGTVKRADIKEDKDGKSRGMGTVTFEQSLEAVQAISMFNGQSLFDRPMHVKMDDKSIPQDDFRVAETKAPQLPRGLCGIGMGLGPGGQPINATRVGVPSGMGNMGPGGMGGGPGFGGMNRMGGGIVEFGGMEGMNNMGGFGGVNRMTDLYHAGLGNGMARDCGRGDMGLNCNFSDSFGGMGGGVGAVGMGTDRMGSNFDRMGTGLDMDRGCGGFGSNQLGSGKRDRIGTKGCQIFVRNLPFDLTWQKLKEKFSQCGHVMFTEIKMENGKSKGCGTVRFDSPETADKACRLMNGMKISGREIDVRMDRNA